jgi:hypothetical protein
MTKEEFAKKYTAKYDRQYNELSDDESSNFTPHKDKFLSEFNALLRETLIKFVKRPADGYNLLFDRAEEIVDHYFKSQQ